MSHYTTEVLFPGIGNVYPQLQIEAADEVSMCLVAFGWVRFLSSRRMFGLDKPEGKSNWTEITEQVFKGIRQEYPVLRLEVDDSVSLQIMGVGHVRFIAVN